MWPYTDKEQNWLMQSVSPHSVRHFAELSQSALDRYIGQVTDFRFDHRSGAGSPATGAGPASPEHLSLLYWGGLVSSAFRLFRRSGVDVARRILASLRDRHAGPPMMGSGGWGGTIYRTSLP